ncbi:MAG: hypothetical protein RL885_01595 [Planctomycetota bacterium]
MSWFKKPVEYRSYSDGSYEIIERRSLLRIGAAALGLSSVIAGGAFVVPRIVAPETVDTPQASIAVEIIKRRDTKAVYQVLSQYDRLDRIAKTDFWGAVLLLRMTDLIPFAKSRLEIENDRAVRDSIQTAIKGLEQLSTNEKR